MYEELVKQALSITDAIPNYNKPHLSIMTPAQFTLPMPPDSHFYTIRKNCFMLCLQHNNHWFLTRREEFIKLDSTLFKSVVCFFCIPTHPVPEAVQHPQISYEPELQKLSEINMIALNIIICTFNRSIDVVDVYHYLSSYVMASYTLNTSKRGNCGNLCFCLAALLLKFTASHPDFIPLEYITFDGNAVNSKEPGHVIIVLNRNNPDMKKIMQVWDYGPNAILIDPYNKTYVRATELKDSSDLAHKYMQTLYFTENAFIPTRNLNTHGFMALLRRLNPAITKQAFLKFIEDKTIEVMKRCGIDLALGIIKPF